MPAQPRMNILLAVLLYLLAWPAFPAEQPLTGIMQLDGQDAPALELQNLDGDSWDIQQARGRWVFVHFWASWCGPCRKEMPTIQTIHSKLDPERIEFAVINTAESEDMVFTFLGTVAPDLNPLMDTDGMVTERWQPRGLPATFLVDPEGKLRYLALGGRPWDTQEYFNFLLGLTTR